MMNGKPSTAVLICFLVKIYEMLSAVFCIFVVVRKSITLVEGTSQSPFAFQLFFVANMSM